MKLVMAFEQFIRERIPRKDISEVFAENPQLANIGTQKQYEKYLSENQPPATPTPTPTATPPATPTPTPTATPTATAATPNTQYMTAGTKFCFFGSCRLDIKVIDKTTSQIISSKGAEGSNVNTLYLQVIKQLQDELTAKKITGVTLPTIDQLEDTSPKK